MPPDPRQIALGVLQRVERGGAYSTLALDAVFRRHPELDRRERAFIHELVLGVLRWRGELDFFIGHYCHRPLADLDPVVLGCLRLGAYQLLHLDGVPDHAAVAESVGLAKAQGRVRAATLVNATLRAIARGREERPLPRGSGSEALAVRTSHPAWLVEQLIDELGAAEAGEALTANNERPPLTVQCNSRLATREELVRVIEREAGGARPCAYAPQGVEVTGRGEGARRVEVTRLPSFRRGLFQVQDEASQIVSHLLAPGAGARVLDACAAPGGKALHLAQMVGEEGMVYALDLHPRRLRLLRSSARRMGLENIRIIAADASKPLPLVAGALRHADGGSLPASGFDAVLLDAPCSNLGVLKRRPEVKWRLTPQDIPRLAAIQRDLLDNLAAWVRPGGVMVYAVCTTTREEGPDQVCAFLDRHREFRRMDVPWPELRDEEGAFRSYPHRHRMDAFYAVRLCRQ